jgi:hypothetical protein
MYRFTVLALVSCLSNLVPLMEGQRLLRIFGPKKDGQPDNWGKLHSEQIRVTSNESHNTTCCISSHDCRQTDWTR